MPVERQKFKYGSAARELDLVRSKVQDEPSFVYVDDILDAFKTQNVDRFEADGVTISCMRDDNGVV